MTENDSRVNGQWKELSEINMDSRFLQPLISSLWSLGKPPSREEVSPPQLCCKFKNTREL